MKPKHLILTLLAILTSITASAYEWTDANGTIWSFTTSGSNATLYNGGYTPCISGTIPENLIIPTTVFIGETPYTVTAIGVGAFYRGRDLLSSISIPASITSIGANAFYECEGYSSNSGLRKVQFESIESLCNIDFADDYNSNPLGKAHHLYINNTEVFEIVIPQGITSIKPFTFYGGSYITSISIPSSIISIGCNAFGNCTSLTSLSIPEGVNTIGEAAFEGCSKLSSINIPSGLSSISDGTFFGCKNLRSIEIPNSITSIGFAAFYNCIRLKRLSIPNSVTSICGGAFSSVTDVTLNSLIPPTLIKGSWGVYNFSSGSAGAGVIIVPQESLDDYKTDDIWSLSNSRIIPRCEWNEATIHVSAKETTSNLYEVIGEENLPYVVSLTINGSINSYDVMIMNNKMTSLRYLDLRNTNIVESAYQYSSNQHTENDVLPSMNSSLRTIKLPLSIKSIGSAAFGNNKNLYDVELSEGIETIGSSAFYYCENISSINLPTTLKSIESSAFQGCSSLYSIYFPPRLERIGSWAFEGTPLYEVHLPEMLRTIGDYAFYSVVNNVYTYTIEPITLSSNVFSNPSSLNLFVPKIKDSYDKYYWDTQWSKFLKISENNHTYDSFYLTNDFNVGDGGDIMEGVPDADFGNQSGYIKEGEEDTQNLGDVDQNITGNGTGASIIGKDDGENTGNLDINHLNVKVSVLANRWYFFCFPYDVTIANCTYPGNYVWKEYQGLLRATSGHGWQTVTGATLNAYDGYAFRTTTAGTLIISFSHPKFGGDRPKALETHVCENAQHASWNFVGNPYSSYYEFQEADFNAPITVWNGSSYTAYTPGDDDYHLRPYEAFFVQKPNGTTQISFDEDRRETYKQSEKKKQNQVKARRARGLNPDRLLTNLYITDNDTSIVDRTRVVLNENKSHAYEMECDAAKFLSTDAVAQIYSIENGVQYAINERPSAGDIRLGYVATKAGRLSIGVDRLDQPMMLVDTQMGTTFDLSLGTYDFDTQAGTFDGRFLLRVAGDQTGLTNIRKQTGAVIGTQQGGIAIGGAEGKTVNVYTISGAQAAQHTGNGFIALRSGVYVVNVDSTSAKVFVK